MAVNPAWAAILGIFNIILKLVQMFKGNGGRNNSEFRKDIDKIKADPVDAFDSMFGGRMRDGRADESPGADADKARTSRTDPSAKS